MEQMRLVSGPAGSGKTSSILQEFRAQIGADVRLLVPTATMAQHLQNRLAREGLVFRRGLIQTLSGFLREWVEDTPEVPRSVLYLLTEDAARRVAHPAFAGVVDLPGFSASLARVIEELAGAGCDSARLAANLPAAPLADAFLAVYREVDRDLARRNLATRGRRLQLAAERITDQGLGNVCTVWVDGFHALPDPEVALIAAIGSHANLTLALDTLDLDDTLRARLTALGFVEERVPRRRARPALQSFQAAGIEREAEEIARRIVEQTAAGRAFRDIGIIVRSDADYVPILRATLARFGIPARFYFPQKLERHAAVRFLSAALNAVLAGWEHTQTLASLRLAPRFADFNALDRFDFDVRQQLPNSGLSDLRALLLDDEGQLRPGADKIAHKLDSLAALEEWRTYSLHPKDWAARFRTLRNLFRPAQPVTGAAHDLALDWRSQAAALDAFDEALDEAALALDPAREIEIDAWWRAVQSILRLNPLRVDDGRRNVVHVLSAGEARQWSLPVVFVCGMTEKQFPRFYTQDPFFPDAARGRLNEVRIRVRTAARFELEERILFESVLDGATTSVTLSYPEFDARGETNLKSLFLDDLMLPSAAAITVRPPLPEALAPHPSLIADPNLFPILQSKTATISPSGLESFLQCPFQFFARATLKLKPPPKRPEDRLDFMRQGEIVHDVLKEWWDEPQDISAVFERVFARVLADNHVPFGYHTERLRNQMLDDLRRFTVEHGWQRNVFQSRTELKFELPLDGVVVSGRIDRLDTSPEGKAYVIDYKYSPAQRVKAKLKSESLLQAPLYLLAARDCFNARPEGVFYIGLKGAVTYAGWSDAPLFDSLPLPENWLALTTDRSLQIVAQIRSGRIAPNPADRDSCGICDFSDACRIESAAAAEAAP
jgi:ATP-dependent helicase/DNAse subunit B